MRRLLLSVFMLPLMAFHPGSQVLKQDLNFQHDSYFREQVYADHDWRSFNALTEAGLPVDPENFDIHLLNAAIFFATNQLREIEGRQTLSYMPGLRDAAACHSRLMTDFRFFSHHNPYQPKLAQPEKRLQCFGVRSSLWGENIAMRTGDEDLSYLELARAIVQDWYDSPGHRKNMLLGGFRYLGCAATLSIDPAWGDLCVRATQDFCGPLP